MTGIIRFALALVTAITISTILFLKRPRPGFATLCLFIAFLGLTVIRDQIDSSFAPHWRLNTLNDYLDSPTAYRAMRANVDGNAYIMLVPDWSPMQCVANVTILRSGAPAYIFDINGTMITWVDDQDENSEFQQQWLDPVQWRAISVRDLRNMDYPGNSKAEPRLSPYGSPAAGSPSGEG